MRNKGKSAAVLARFLQTYRIAPPEPYVIQHTVFVQIDDAGGATAQYLVRDHGTATPHEAHYSPTQVANIVDPGRLADVLGLPEPLALDLFSHLDPGDAAAIEELRLQRCDDCGQILTAHEDLYWRFSVHRIRCDNCARLAQARANYDWWEARYVC